MLRRRAVQQRGCLVLSFYCSGTTSLICCLFGFNNSKDMLLYLFLLFFTFIALGSMNSIKPQSTEEHVAEGRDINLTCKYEGAIINIQWYRQYQRSRPEFLLYITEGGLIHPTGSGFSAHINKAEKHVDLEIISAKVSHSAVYYCALQPDTGGGNLKMIFGSGTRLTVEPKEDYKPSFYKLSDGETTACLATGFSRLQAANITHNDIFKKTSAVRIGDDSLYNAVALLSSKDDKCQPAEDGAVSELCEDTLEPDAKVNLMSLTILGLRLLFLKTIVFNVLLTLRLWISH